MYVNNNPSVGDTLQVRITAKQSYGVFVRMPNGRDGLIRLNDISWQNQAKILGQLSVGEVFMAKVIKELPDGKLNLSRRELLPNPRTLEVGTIISGVVESTRDFGLIVHLGDFTALALRQGLYNIPYNEGDDITSVVVENVYDEEKHRYKILLSLTPIYDNFAKNHEEGEHILCKYIKTIHNENAISVLASYDNILFLVPLKRLAEPFKTKLTEDSLVEGTELELEYIKYNERLHTVVLDMRPIEQEKKKAHEDWLKSQLERGSICAATVIRVDDKGALVNITDTEVSLFIPREELSPNKIIRATDEVFVGEQIQIVYLGEINGKMSFTRKYLVEDKYDEKLYDLSLEELLKTMDINTYRFVGKVISIHGSYFMSNLMSVAKEGSEDNGKLLIDPVNGKNLIVVIDNRLRNFVEEGNFYEVDITLASKEYRLKQGTPYMFSVMSNNILRRDNPYKDSVILSFKKQTSPSSNTSLANLLEEVGQNLYTSKKRMFFELLQNADDAASLDGVKIKLQLRDGFFVLTHDGYSFNKHDFDSIISAAKSTKSASKKKTGYKGIGFKSVFTNSTTVSIKSGGYTFSFDKHLSEYSNFKDFYFHVNDIVDDQGKQIEFLHKYEKEYREFNGVKDIPWQLLPIWSDDLKLPIESSIFNKNENVAIALKMDFDTLAEYSEAVKEVFDEPRFMLFLRNTHRIQLINGNECLTIQKNVNREKSIVSLVNSFSDDKFENYSIIPFDNIIVNDDAFSEAGVHIKRGERTNNRGEKENFFIKTDPNGNSLGEVSGIPDRIASTTETTISFALSLDANGHIRTIGEDELSFYAYLPMNEHRFKFPFYVNADFIPKSDREGVQSDNPWNYFLFYSIGKSIVKMVESIASVDEPEYLKLLPIREFVSTSQDTSMLVDSFNKGYKETLQKTPLIINDENEKVKLDSIVIDTSGLSLSIGNEEFYKLLGINKRLPSMEINSDILTQGLFGVDCVSVDTAFNILSRNIQNVNNWIVTSSPDVRMSFYSWISKDKKTISLISQLKLFKYGDTWKSVSEVSLQNKTILITEKITPIKNILIQLGFSCSDDILEEHVLSEHIKKQDEKTLFAYISSSDISGLSFSQRLLLFENIAEFDEIGREALRKWAIFKNCHGDFTPLSLLFKYNPNCPSWLSSFMLLKEENTQQLDKYLIESSAIYSEIVEPKIDTLVSNTDVTLIYNVFRQYWNQSLTTKLMSMTAIPQKSLLFLVEQSDDTTKTLYIKGIKSFNLVSTATYDTNSYEYRTLKMVASNDTMVGYMRSVMTIDGIKLSEITLKDDFTLSVNNNQYVFSLSKILPAYSNSSTLSLVATKFRDIASVDKIFAQKEATPVDVRNKLYNYLINYTGLLSVEQYCFLMMYRRSCGYLTFDNTLRPYIRVNNTELFTRIMDRCMELNVGTILGDFIKESTVIYPCGKLNGTYIDCDELTLPTERVPIFIKVWANTDDRKKFLLDLGVHNIQSKEMERRKSFRDGKKENIWNLTDSIVIRSFISWVKETFSLPIVNDNQVEILNDLFRILRISTSYYEDDFSQSSEWGNELYLKWKSNVTSSIFIVDGKLPYRGYYDNTYLFKGKTGEFTYFQTSHRFYISSDREPASILADVYSSGIYPFKKEDWNKIFLVSADLVKEKDEIIAELQQKIEELRHNQSSDVEVGGHGKFTEKDSTDETSRYEINRKARIAAKEYLDNLSDYDCEGWDPNDDTHLIQNVVKYKGKPITLAVTSSQRRKLYLHPRVFAELMCNPDNLLLNYGIDKKIHPLSFEDVFMDNPDVNLIFDTDVISPGEIAELANRYMGSKRTCFVIENPKYSASETIQSFGLNEKKKDGWVSVNLSDSDIFNF